jgi:hypothetical protein
MGPVTSRLSVQLSHLARQMPTAGVSHRPQAHSPGQRPASAPLLLLLYGPLFFRPVDGCARFVDIARRRAERQPNQRAYTFLLDGETSEQHHELWSGFA